MAAASATARHGTVVCGACLLLLAASAPAADKTDVVHFANGDRLTGEVKKLERGKLSFKTDATGTIQIEWQDVASVTSAQHFDIIVESGEKFFGSLVAADEGRLEVADGEQAEVLELASVVYLTPIEEGFLKRIDGSVDFGFSFTESDDRSQLSLGAEISYETRKLLRKATLNSITASQSGVDETERTDLSLFLLRQLSKPKRGLFTVASLQRNEELGIDLRSLVGGGAGWRAIQTNSENLTLLGGLQVTRENLDEAADNRENLESLFGLQFESFRFDSPERDIRIALTVFPSLSESGRVRAELDAKIRWEILHDFFVGLTLLESYDSDPPTAKAEKSDLSLITSFGWSF